MGTQRGGPDWRAGCRRPGEGESKQIILSVKSGHVSVRDVRDLRGVIERERAEIGVLITLEEPTKPMETEAASAGFYKGPGSQANPSGNYPRLQIRSIAELLDGKGLQIPPSANVTFKRAPKAETPVAEKQLTLTGEAETPRKRRKR